MARTLGLFTAAFLLLGSGCGGGATAKLQLQNSTGTSSGALTRALMAPAPPGYLGLKLMNVYLAEDVDPVSLNNVGVISEIWTNPRCNDPSQCDDFDFARSTSEVNADLNSQTRAVSPGTYRYLRLDFCNGKVKEQTITWRAGAMANTRSFQAGDCGRTSQIFNPPLVLKAGDSVSVTAGYDLGTALVSDSVDTSDSALMGRLGNDGLLDAQGNVHSFRDCEDASGTRTCMDFPDFVPTATRIAGP